MILSDFLKGLGLDPALAFSSQVGEEGNRTPVDVLVDFLRAKYGAVEETLVKASWEKAGREDFDTVLAEAIDQNRISKVVQHGVSMLRVQDRSRE